MKKTIGFSILALSALAAMVFAQTGSLAIRINGKTVPGKTLVSKGQTYVPVSALKAAGATVSTANGTMSISFAGEGGANQIGAVEGGLNTWLFNGIWRFQVTSVVPNDDGRAGWKVGVELRNGSKLENVALAGTGFAGLTLVFEDGNTVTPYNQTDLVDKPVNQGGSVKLNLVFYDDDGNGRKPSKLILRLEPDDFTKKLLKGRGASFTVADPSFRVNLAP